MTRRLLATEGESGRFEFKQDDEAVSTAVLVAAANAAELEALGHVTVLVGVKERQDLRTGVVTGRVLGLQDVERARGKIVSRASQTKPVPVGLTIVEENLGTSRPILRLEVRPTRVPHYTNDGRRVTRYGASTRAITDEELLDLYLQREREAFEARFRRTAAEITEELGSLAHGIEALDRELRETGDRLHEIHSLADLAAVASEEGRDVGMALEETLGQLQAALEELHQSPPSFEEAWWDHLRSRGLGRVFLTWLAEKPGMPRSEVEAILYEALRELPRPLEYERNIAQSRAWRELVDFMVRHDVVDDADAVLAAANRVRSAGSLQPDPEDLVDEVDRSTDDPL